jgi:hypothetical protein
VAAGRTTRERASMHKCIKKKTMNQTEWSRRDIQSIEYKKKYIFG